MGLRVEVRALLFLDLALSLFCIRWLSFCACAWALLVHVRVGVGLQTTGVLMGLQVEVRALLFLGLDLALSLFCFRWLSFCTCAWALLVHVRVGVGLETTVS